MSVDRASYEDLLQYKIPEVEHTLSKRDTMLYALGVGLGADPMDERQFRLCMKRICSRCRAWLSCWPRRLRGSEKRHRHVCRSRLPGRRSRHALRYYCARNHAGCDDQKTAGCNRESPGHERSARALPRAQSRAFGQHTAGVCCLSPRRHREVAQGYCSGKAPAPIARAWRGRPSSQKR